MNTHADFRVPYHAGTRSFPLTINEDWCCIETEAEVDPETGHIVSVRLGGWNCPPHILEEMVQPDEMRRIEADMLARATDALAMAADDYDARADADYDDSKYEDL